MSNPGGPRQKKKKKIQKKRNHEVRPAGLRRITKEAKTTGQSEREPKRNGRIRELGRVPPRHL